MPKLLSITDTKLQILRQSGYEVRMRAYWPSGAANGVALVTAERGEENHAFECPWPYDLVDNYTLQKRAEAAAVNRLFDYLVKQGTITPDIEYDEVEPVKKPASPQVTDTDIVDFIEQHGLDAAACILRGMQEMCSLGGYAAPTLRGAFAMHQQVHGFPAHTQEKNTSK